jgi:alpha-L-rhamnosidase
LTLTAGSGDYTFTVTPPATPFTTLKVTASAKGSDVTAVVESRSEGGFGHGDRQRATGLDSDLHANPAHPATTASTTTVHLTEPADVRNGVYPVTVTRPGRQVGNHDGGRAGDRQAARRRHPARTHRTW